MQAINGKKKGMTVQPGLGMTEPKTLHYGLWDGSSTILCAYILVFILLCIKRKEYPHIFMLLIPSSAILLALYYCPLLNSMLTAHMPVGNQGRIQVLRRLRWIMLVLPMLAFGLTYLTLKADRLKKAVIAVICVFMVFLSVYGSDWSASGMKTGYWNRGNDFDHLYKISNISLAMGDTIMEENRDFFEADRKNTVKILVGNDKTGGKYGDRRDGTYFVLGLRQYLSPVQYRELDLTDGDYYRDIDRNDDYVLCPDRQDYIDSFISSGYEEEWTMDGYCFLKKGKDL